jgi:hypothetical protein
LATRTAYPSTKRPQKRLSESTTGRGRNLGQYDLPPEIDDGLYMVGGDDDDFGQLYDIRAMTNYLEKIDAPPDYVMSDEEMQQFRRR